jgi:hypothetical protein
METFAHFAIPVAVGAAVAWYDMRFFAVYAFAATVGLIIYGLDRLWKLITVHQTMTSFKILAIMEKVGVAEADVKRAMMNEQDKYPKDYGRFEEIFRNL